MVACASLQQVKRVEDFRFYLTDFSERKIRINISLKIMLLLSKDEL